MDDRYTVDVVVCHACAARERAAERVRDTSDGAPQLHGVMFVTNPDYPDPK